MSKKKGIILAIVGTVLIFLGVLYAVIEGISNDKKLEEEKISNINKNYKELSSYAEEFNEIRNNYTETVVSNLYDESVEEEYTTWVLELDKYKEIVDKIMVVSEPLEELCIGQVYGDKDTNNQCKSYTISYETCMNYFVKDVGEFNEFITSYLSKYDNDNNIKTYDLDKDKYFYVDVDDDGEFIGKK